MPKTTITEKVLKIINQALRHISIPDLKRASRISLLNFYYSQYREISQINGYKLLLLLACIKITDKGNSLVKMPVSRAKAIINNYALYDDVKQYGVPLQKFSKDYIQNDVKPVLDRLAKQYAKDPDDYTGRNSLRNRAEMEVRYNGHNENINELRKQGNRLVIASTHADCSERCSKWQGRVYSLDGTSGTTPDGRKYIPLETATDVYYTTKAGKTYKNGLLGFNCRHHLVAYKDGFNFPKPNPAEEHKEYKITQKQRSLERVVRYWRTEAIMYKDINPQYYKIAKQSAIEANQEYIRFSHDNGRAYYPSRTKIL